MKLNHRKINLGSNADINTGVVVNRKKAELNQKIKAKYKILSLKSFENDGWLNLDELDVLDSIELLDDRYLTSVGDVIIRLSAPYTAIAINKESKGLIYQSLFTRIRLKNNEILPEYLAIYLNSDKMKKLLMKYSVGSAISIIKTSWLRDLMIEVPPADYQEKVIKVYNQIIKEKQLLSKLITNKEKYYQSILKELI